MPTTSRPRARSGLTRVAFMVLALAALALLHALLTPAGTHLAAEDPGCSHDRRGFTADRCPPAVAMAPPGGQQHPEHDPAARVCESAAAKRPTHPAPQPAISLVAPALSPLDAFGPTRSLGLGPIQDGGVPAVSRQILRC
ncbi:hypothetical protein ACLQ2N_02480 [Streptomyces sp. DT224]|uniref:hypothetical protein n=1 Tax=unclassified Streptomyces TaxID=2593676 RepID=UPI0011CDAD5F|nr:MULTISPECIES: hypothetical protein [unclassified Streptomyces]TXS38247.1 hypothetical protein EAO72_34180 [Streptomyces sp. or43]WRZ03580.1 hypothetical protein OG959_09595 [Streptomyces sp. NBC_00385]